MKKQPKYVLVATILALALATTVYGSVKEYFGRTDVTFVVESDGEEGYTTFNPTTENLTLYWNFYAGIYAIDLIEEPLGNLTTNYDGVCITVKVLYDWTLFVDYLCFLNFYVLLRSVDDQMVQYSFYLPQDGFKTGDTADNIVSAVKHIENAQSFCMSVNISAELIWGIDTSTVPDLSLALEYYASL